MSSANTLVLEGQQLGGKQPLFTKREIEVPEDWPAGGESVSLRALLRHLVLLEVEAFQERQEERQLFRILTADQIAAGQARGRIDPEGKRDRGLADVRSEQAVETAVLAFEDGLFFVFIDDKQIEELEEPVHLGQNSRMLFVRLVALAGG